MHPIRNNPTMIRIIENDWIPQGKNSACPGVLAFFPLGPSYSSLKSNTNFCCLPYFTFHRQQVGISCCGESSILDLIGSIAKEVKIQSASHLCDSFLLTINRSTDSSSDSCGRYWTSAAGEGSKPSSRNTQHRSVGVTRTGCAVPQQE